MDEDLRAAAERARAVFPEVSLSQEVFLEVLRQRKSVEHANDLYLACACGSGDAVALAELDRLYLAPLHVALARFDDRALVDEVRQKLRLKLFVGDAPQIRTYLGKGPLKSWVRAAAVRMAISMLRERRDQSDDGIERLPVAGDPELDYIKRRYRAPFQAAFRAALAGLPARERTLLQLYFVDGLSLAEIGRLQGVHEATISRRLAATRGELLERTRAALAENLDVDAGELDSLMQLVSSRIDVSLPGLMSRA